MVEFITLFLGLVAGPHTVQVMVDDRVAAVELRLDGRSVSSIEGEPWSAIVHFREDLRSRELVAVALDGAGVELGRATQALNRPRPHAEANILLERDPNGRVVAARLEWQSTAKAEPVASSVTFDGKPLGVERLTRFELPAHKQEDFHVLQADLYFDLGVSAHAQATFGGRYLDETSGQLTAVVVRPQGGRKVPKNEELRGAFSSGSLSVPLVAIEKGPAEAIFVRADGVVPVVANLDGKPFTGAGRIPMAGMSVSAADNSDRLRATLSLPTHHQMRLLVPHASQENLGHLTFDSFLISPAVSSRSGGVFWLLSQGAVVAGAPSKSRLVDAVAVAGLQAARGNRRRAVVLVTRDGTADASNLRPEAVRAYLRDLDVPLHVWHVGENDPPSGWPSAVRIGSFPDLRQAVRALERDLERQRIVWLGGGLPPEAIAVPEAIGLERAGAPDSRN